MAGQVYIASMNCRGVWAPHPPATVINVTSAQAKNSKNRRDFSPMTEIPGKYKGYWNFEHYWQKNKVFDGIDQEVATQWWLTQTTPKRRYPKSKGHQVLYADFNGEQLDYVESRKQIYVPEYFNLIKDREMTNHWRQYVLDGNDVVVYDFDGPRLPNNNVTCLPVTLDLLKEKILHTQHPFGHGIIVGGYLAGFTPDDYI